MGKDKTTLFEYLSCIRKEAENLSGGDLPVVSTVSIQFGENPNNVIRVKGVFHPTGFTPIEAKMPDEFIPDGYRKCKECGAVFKTAGKRLFHTESCRSRFHARKSLRKKRAANKAASKV